MFLVEVSSTPALLKKRVTVRRYFTSRWRAWWEFVRVAAMCGPYLKAEKPRNITGPGADG